MEKQDIMPDEIRQEPGTENQQIAGGSGGIQWHPAFCSAMELELYNQSGSFIFIREHSLTKKPLSVDFLVIQKDRGTVVENDIGKLFKGHNLMEYKSPEEGMGIDVFYKLAGYACLYKAEAPEENGVPVENITISLVREGYPRELILHLKEAGFEITKPYNGIFYAKREGFFDTQIIVSRFLDKDNHIWLTSLTRSLSYESALKLVAEAAGFKEKHARDLADSVLDVVIRANREKFNTVKEEETDMGCPALMELFQTEMEEALTKTRASSRAEGRAEGRTEEQEQISALGLRMKAENRIDDFFRGLSDLSYRETLLREYGMLTK